jgi:hypothetical protein
MALLKLQGSLVAGVTSYKTVKDRIWLRTKVFYCDLVTNMHNRMKVAFFIFDKS